MNRFPLLSADSRDWNVYPRNVKDDPDFDHALRREQDLPQARYLLRKAGRENLTVTLVTSPIATATARAQALYEPLVQLDADAGTEYVLASEMTPHNSAVTEWVIRLRPGVRFHDREAADCAV